MKMIQGEIKPRGESINKSQELIKIIEDMTHNTEFGFWGSINNDQALYLYKMFQADVQDKKVMRRNYNLRQLRKDIKNIGQSYPEFINYVEGLIENGVITEKTYKDLYLMITEPEEEYKKIYDFL